MAGSRPHLQPAPVHLKKEVPLNTPDLIARFYLAVQPVDDPANSEHDINIWIVNDTDHDLRYEVRTGEFTSLDDRVLQSTVAHKPSVILPARSTRIFAHEEDWGLDFVVWWHLDVTDADGGEHRLSATRGKYGWFNTDEYVDIPHTTVRGKRLLFTVRR